MNKPCPSTNPLTSVMNNSPTPQPLTRHANDYNCPHCRTENTLSLANLYRNGIQTVNVSGWGQEFGGKLSHVSASGTQVSATSKRYAPPKLDPGITERTLIILALIFLLIVTINVPVTTIRLQAFALFLILAGASAVWYKKTSKKKQEQYRFKLALYKTWKEAWICLRCECVFIPGDNQRQRVDECKALQDFFATRPHNG